MIAFYRRLGYVDAPTGRSGAMVDLMRPVTHDDGQILISQPD